MTLHDLLLLGLALLVASSLPFIPTGELVSAAAALVAVPSAPLALAIFAVAWVCSCAGDTILLSGSRLLTKPLQRWRRGRPENAKAQRARRLLARNTFAAVVTSRLVPGMRAPVILALGVAGIHRRAFVKADLVGCGIWAALYTVLGSVGGRLTTNPVIGVAAAVLLAVAVSSVAGLVIRRRRSARTSSD